MATDWRLFEPQLLAIPNLLVPSWIKPFPREPLHNYARRMAREVDPGCPCIVGGASFGGAVALEMATQLQAKACLLIGSIRSSDELPWYWRALRPVATLGPEWLQLAASLLARIAALRGRSGSARRWARLASPDSTFVRWALCAVLRWRPSEAARRVRVFQIHGEADQTLSVRWTRPNMIVPSGGHALPLTNSASVTQFIRKCVQTCIETNGAP
jgi:pimeloyl-ACP methyl ester carboxylesterase